MDLNDIKEIALRLHLDKTIPRGLPTEMFVAYCWTTAVIEYIQKNNVEFKAE